METDKFFIKTVFNKIKTEVKQKQNYVPRNYETIGGMWTVDTYKKGNVTLQVMDEGWTTKIFTDKVSVIESGGRFKFDKGTVDDFDLIYKSIS